ncbi:MAG TPA: hypothetical protein VLH79_11490 [Chthonomonadales bacterium]|nr:hypothetical protein [Chthonomonadales bacterium]
MGWRRAASVLLAAAAVGAPGSALAHGEAGRQAPDLGDRPDGAVRQERPGGAPSEPVQPGQVPRPADDAQRFPAALAGVASIVSEELEVVGSLIRARGVTMTLGEYMLAGERLEGDLDGEIVFTGNPSLTYRGQELRGDLIRFAPRTRAYRIEGLRSGLSSDFLQGRLLSPLYLTASSIAGVRGEPIIGSQGLVTTCDREVPHYVLGAAAIEVEPGRRATLRRAALNLWGHRLLTLPTFVVPLDERSARLRTRRLPNVGRSAEEGWYAKSTFDFGTRGAAPGVLHLDVMERKGIGVGVDQEWDTPRVAGHASFYAIPTGGTQRDLSARISGRLSLGEGQGLRLASDFQRNSFQAMPETTSLNYRLSYDLRTQAASTLIGLGRQATESGGLSTRTHAATLTQSLQLSRTASVNLQADYSRHWSAGRGLTTGLTTFEHLTEQLTTRLQADQRAPNYTLRLVANRSVPVGAGAAQSFFGGVERLPELSLTNFRFTGGWLAEADARFAVSAGRFSEGRAGRAARRRIMTERVVTSVDIDDRRYALSATTDANIGVGFRQYWYADGYAQYVLRSRSSLTQRWSGRSVLNVTHNYQQPHGGTPFRFDVQSRTHTLDADVGFLDDRRLQLTARVGYDFSGSSFGGVRRPWHTLAANVLVRPAEWARMQYLASFDPNSGRLTSVVSDWRFRGTGGLAIDVVARYDPARRRFGSVNSFFDLPVGSVWRVAGLFQYNGHLGRFESRNLQIVRDLHCLEASLTFMENPHGFRNDRQIFFQLRIKALPVFQRFGVGQFGQALDTGVGGLE